MFQDFSTIYQKATMLILLTPRVPKVFEKTSRSDFFRAAQSVPARTRKWFLMRFDSKTNGNLDEDQKGKGLLRILM